VSVTACLAANAIDQPKARQPCVGERRDIERIDDLSVLEGLRTTQSGVGL
jgi:hypothetical protein